MRTSQCQAQSSAKVKKTHALQAVSARVSRDCRAATPIERACARRTDLLVGVKASQRAMRSGARLCAAAEPRARGAVVVDRLVAMLEALVQSSRVEVGRGRDGCGTLARAADRRLERNERGGLVLFRQRGAAVA